MRFWREGLSKLLFLIVDVSGVDERRFVFHLCACYVCVLRVLYNIDIPPLLFLTCNIKKCVFSCSTRAALERCLCTKCYTTTIHAVEHTYNECIEQQRTT